MLEDIKYRSTRLVTMCVFSYQQLKCSETITNTLQIFANEDIVQVVIYY